LKGVINAMMENEPTTSIKKDQDDMKLSHKDGEVGCRFLHCANSCLETESVLIIPRKIPDISTRQIKLDGISSTANLDSHEVSVEHSSIISETRLNSECCFPEKNLCTMDNGKVKNSCDLETNAYKRNHGGPIDKIENDSPTQSDKPQDSTCSIKKNKPKRRKRNITHVITTSVLPRPADSGTSCQFDRIYVKPLIVLDLNGILMHRIRSRNIPPSIIDAILSPDSSTCIDKSHSSREVDEVQMKQIATKIYRPATANIAGTDIVQRTDLHEFLTLLDKYFCVAVWTSAKKKNAKKFINLLFPPDISRRLLFVWGQERCKTVVQGRNEDNPTINSMFSRETIFMKILSKVWEAFPCWNDSNTLLIDDSCEKCPSKYKKNTIHPPPILGLNPAELTFISGRMPDEIKQGDDCETSKEILNANKQKYMDHEIFQNPCKYSKEQSFPSNIYFDDFNQKIQTIFFEKLASRWTLPQNNETQIFDSKPLNSGICNDGILLAFLDENARGHMGWRM